MISIITEILGKALSSKIPATGQTVKDFATSKTNALAGVVMTYGMTLLATNPSDKMGHFYIIASLFAWTIKDAIAKK